MQPKLSSRRVISTNTRVTKRDIVIGDVGYTLRKGFKWKGKLVIIDSKLQKMRVEKVRKSAAANNQSKTNSSRKTHVP